MNPYDLRQRFYNFVNTKSPWYKIVNSADGSVRNQIWITDAIGSMGVSADDFVNDLNKLQGPVELRLASEGGEVFQAKTIYNALASRPDVSVYVDGLAASAASFVAMAASPGKLFMSRIGTLMIHDGHTLAMGAAADLRQLADVLDRESNTIASIYAERTGKTVDYFREKMRAETWYNANEALAEGLCDGVIDPRTGSVSHVANQLLNAAHHPYTGRHEHMHEPMTGMHSHNHAAFGEPDADDGIHAHAHSHSGHATHDHEHILHDHTHDGHGNHEHAHIAGMEHLGMDRHDHMHTHDASIPHDPGMAGRGADYTGQTVDVDDVADSLLNGPVVMATAFPEAAFYNRTFTTEQRKAAASKGHALKDGSYPIENCEDAKNARQAYGRAPQGKRAAVASHIRKREAALSCQVDGPFSPGDNTDFVITDEEIAAFAANFRL